MSLPTAVLGRTGRTVTRLGFGSMSLRSAGSPENPGLDRATAGRVLQSVLDSGITYIDTSQSYGVAEELIGEYLGHRRDEFFLADKAGFVTDETPVTRHLFSADVVRKGVEWSLRRLRTDHLDLVQFPGSPTPAELTEHGALEEVQALQAEGKVAFLGVSGWVPNLYEQISFGAFDVFQIPFSLLEQENEQLISDSAAAGMGTVVRGGVAQGAPVLTNEQLAERRSGNRQEKKELWRRAGIEGLLGDLSPLELLLRYTLSHPDVHTTIVGTSSLEHLKANVAAAERGPLPADLVAKLRDGVASTV